jgi:2-oxoglutarate dehydrogenase E2 component (dihydrolipoamide succinyltransferase)
MSVDVLMPKLGESITEGTILEWKKEVGDDIKKDETLLEISTDKVDSEIPSPESGKIIQILYKVNDVVPVGEVIARIGSNNDKVIKQVKDIPKTDDIIDDNSTLKNNEIDDLVVDSNNVIKEKQHFYSPLVKSIAKKENISLAEMDNIPGTGLNNRVNKNDILNYIKSNESLDINKSKSDITYSLNDKLEPMGHVRLMIADHMKKSRDTSVHVYSTSEVDITNIVNYRNANKNKYLDKYQTNLTYTPFFIDSVIKSIQGFPLINASIQGKNIVNNLNINIGVAVALPDDNLIVPVIKKSEELNFLGVARACSDLAQRARENNLEPNEVKDSTFTITNPGVFGSLFGMGIINQPNSALLSIGAIHKRPVVKETKYGDVVVVRSMIYLTLAYDHRIIDGAYGTRFLTHLKNKLENFNEDDLQ